MTDRRIIMIGVLCVALVIALVWGGQQRSGLEAYRTYLENQYHRSFFELVDTVDNLEVRLSKMMVTASPSQSIVLLSEVWRQASAAQEQLSHLPMREAGLSGTARFINQLGDYAYTLTKKAADGTPITQDEMDQLTALHNQCVDISAQLALLRNHVETGLVRWADNPLVQSDKATQAADAGQADSLPIDRRQFDTIEKTVVEYPTLIYDGPFSDSVQNALPKALPNTVVDEQGALDAAALFLGERAGGLTAQPTEGQWPGWICTQPGITLHVSQTGVVIWMIEETSVTQARLQLDECTDRGLAFLQQLGMGDFLVSFWQVNDGVAVINYAAAQDGVLLYPDLVKLKIAMDDGRIIGFEAGNYWINHIPRSLHTPQLTIDDARSLVSSQLDIKGERLVLIPTETRGERVCYEFEGHFGDELFMVYINADTGKEENVLRIINTDNGSLAM